MSRMMSENLCHKMDVQNGAWDEYEIKRWDWKDEINIGFGIAQTP